VPLQSVQFSSVISSVLAPGFSPAFLVLNDYRIRVCFVDGKPSPLGKLWKGLPIPACRN
jgi:hypothetical protein